MAELVFRSTTRGGKDFFEVTDDGSGKDRYSIKTDGSMDYADTVDEVLAELVFDGAWRVNYDKIEIDELGIGEEYKEIAKLIRQKYNWLYNLPKGSKGRQFYFDIGRYFKQKIAKGVDYDKIFDEIDKVIKENNNFEESKKGDKSMKLNEKIVKVSDLEKALDSSDDWECDYDRILDIDGVTEDVYETMYYNDEKGLTIVIQYYKNPSNFKDTEVLSVKVSPFGSDKGKLIKPDYAAQYIKDGTILSLFEKKGGKSMKEAKIDFEDRKEALAKFLKLDDEEKEDIEEGYDEKHLEYNRDEYLVVTDEEADEEFEDYQRSLWDDMGILSYSESFQDWIMNNAIDSDWFENAMDESNRYYAEDIKNEKSRDYANRLVEECYDNGLIDDDDFEKDEDGEPNYEECTKDEDDLIDMLVDYMKVDDAVEWYRNNFGDDDFRDIVIKHNLVDMDAVIEETKSWDGRGCLATYDRIENSEKVNGEWFYIYRTN